MPSLVLFGRRSIVAGDDLKTFAFMGILVALTQIGLLIPLTVFHVRNTDIYKDMSNLCQHASADKLNGMMWAHDTTSIVLALSSIVILARVFCISGQGTPVELEKRKPLKPLCQTNMVLLTILRIACVTLGLLIEARDSGYIDACFGDCETWPGGSLECENDKNELHHSYNIFVVLVKIQIVELALIAAFSLLIFIKYLPASFRLSSYVAAETRWKVCCQCCCTLSSVLSCCMFGGKDVVVGGDFTDVAIALSDHFKHLSSETDVDVVPSDIFAGLVMVLRTQRQCEDECQEKINEVLAKKKKERDESRELQKQAAVDVSLVKNDTPIDLESGDHSLACGEWWEEDEDNIMFRLRREGNERSGRRRSSVFVEATQLRVLHKNNLSEKSAIAEGARFMRLSLAMYTWMLHVIQYPCTGPCQLTGLVAKRLLCGGKQHHSRYAGDTNCCRLHETTLLEVAGLKQADLVYAQFRVGYAETPYCLAIDHEWKSIVVAIRGTLSLDDALADLTVRPESLEKLGKECGFDGTDSFVHSGVLACTEWIYRDLQTHGYLDELMANEEYSDYMLRVTGHSLGAGCAAVLAILLRPKYKDRLRCLPFSPPGCTLSQNLVDESKEYTTSYILDADIVPRLSVEAVNHVRNDILDNIACIKVPKYKIIGLGRAAMPRCSKDKQENSDDDSDTDPTRRLLHRMESMPSSTFLAQLRDFHEKEQRHEEFPNVNLLPPGKIVHLLHTRDEVTGLFGRKKQKLYTPRWADALDFQEIRLSGHCLHDHDPGNVLRALERAAKDFGIQPPYADAK